MSRNGTIRRPLPGRAVAALCLIALLAAAGLLPVRNGLEQALRGRLAMEALPAASPGLFGTLAEARSVAGKAAREDYARIILVTSPLHARRTWLTFSAVFSGGRPALSLYLSEDRAGLKDLLAEYAKLLLYTAVVLPVCVR